MKSPFSGVLAVGYYDGVTDGWLMTWEGRVFLFEMIDEDEGHEVRVYAVGSALTGDVEARVRGEIRKRGKFETVVRPGEEIGGLYSEQIAAGSSAIAVFAAVNPLRDIVHWCPARGDSRLVDWMSMFGLPRLVRD